MTKNPFAEIVESSLNKWKAQVWDSEFSPDLGSLVVLKCNKYLVFGLIYNIEICSSDPNRIITAYKKDYAELKRDQPQIFQFLKTNFDCITVGYKDQNKLFYQLFPNPAFIHSFVYFATDEQIAEFFSDDQYLQLIFNSSSLLFSLEELLLVILKNLSDKSMLRQEYLEKFIESFSLLTGNDYRRLKLFLKRVEPILSNI